LVGQKVLIRRASHEQVYEGHTGTTSIVKLFD